VGGEIDPLGVGVRELVSAMNELEKLGLSKLDIPLAKCIVCGDQSAGKSSVIEAISGINVPRAGGTCTRCPMFIRLECSAETEAAWQAKVCLRKTYDFYGEHSRAGRDSKFFPWVPNDSLSPERDFATTNNRADLKTLIYRAQLAILNPGQNPMSYVPGSTDEIVSDHCQIEFSPNTVCIYISAPGLPNLSFYDLPGIITQVQDRSKRYLTKLVKELVAEYVEDPNALVLLACSLEVDIQVSSAASIADEKGAAGRCVGVLTKPDRLPSHSRVDELRNVLNGQAYALGHGYFVVKQPGQDGIERGITHREARIEEEKFFDRQEPWSTTFSAHRHQFGTRNLQTALSKKLAAQTLQILPQIKSQIDKHIESVELELNKIPKPPTQDVTGIVRDTLRTFTESVRKEVLRDTNCNTWRLTWDRLRKGFSQELESLRPILQTKGLQDYGLYKPAGPETIDLLSDDEDISIPQPVFTPTPKKRKLASPSATPSKASIYVSSKASPANKKAPHRSELAIRYNLDETRGQLYEMSSAKLSRQVNPKAVEHLMLQSLINWSIPLKSFFDNLERDLRGRLQQLLDQSFAKWRTTELYRASSEIVQKFLDVHFGVQRLKMAPDALKDELEGPYVFDLRHFDFHMTSITEAYKKARFFARMNIYFDELQGETGKELSTKEREAQAMKEPVKSLLSRDPYDREVDVIAQVRAYYELASIRFQESICMRIESQLFNTLGTDLFDELKGGLQITDEKGEFHERCVQLLAEDPEREVRRVKLEGRKAALLAGQKCLLDLDQKYHDRSTPHTANGTFMSGFDTFGNGSAYAHEDTEMDCA
ncbi:P-loop containing nucleoside triphosphate hydrolase protein, partial [Zopfia rhizophila CBS 207.26]